MRTRTRMLISIAAGGTIVLSAWLFVGVFIHREFHDPHLFLKHSPTFKFIFRAPIGEADRSFTPGTEGYLSPEDELEEAAYVEYVEEHGGWKRSIFLP